MACKREPAELNPVVNKGAVRFPLPAAAGARVIDEELEEDEDEEEEVAAKARAVGCAAMAADAFRLRDAAMLSRSRASIVNAFSSSLSSSALAKSESRLFAKFNIPVVFGWLFPIGGGWFSFWFMRRRFCRSAYEVRRCGVVPVVSLSNWRSSSSERSSISTGNNSLLNTAHYR